LAIRIQIDGKYAVGQENLTKKKQVSQETLTKTPLEQKQPSIKQGIK
jgi:hypothetical protein